MERKGSYISKISEQHSNSAHSHQFKREGGMRQGSQDYNLIFNNMVSSNKVNSMDNRQMRKEVDRQPNKGLEQLIQNQHYLLKKDQMHHLKQQNDYGSFMPKSD